MPRIFHDSYTTSGGKQHFRRSSIIEHRDVAVGGATFINEIKELGGIRPQDIQVLHKCDTNTNANYGAWAVSGGFSSLGDSVFGPTNNNGTTGTSVNWTAGTTSGRAYFTPVTPRNLLGKKYIGFYLNMPTGKDAIAGALKLELYGSGNTDTSAGGDLYKTFDLPAITGATSKFIYVLIDISSASEALLSKITRIAIAGVVTSTSSVLSIYLMEAFYWAYAQSSGYSGPVRGLIMEVPVEPGSSAIVSGVSLAFNELGQVKTITSSTTQSKMFAGVALEAADASATYDGSVTVKMVVDGVVNRSAAVAIKYLCSILFFGATSIIVGTGSLQLRASGYALSPAAGLAGCIPVLIRPHGYCYFY